MKLKNQSDGSTAKSNSTNMFLHDSGEVSINTRNKKSTFTVFGSISFQLQRISISAGQQYFVKASDYTVVLTQFGASTGTSRINLPSADAYPGRILNLVYRGVLAINMQLFSPSGDRVIGGLAAGLVDADVTTLGLNSTMKIQSDGLNWYVIGSSTLGGL